MSTLTHTELKARLDRSEPIQLVMTLGREHFQYKHIPGSLQFDSYAAALHTLRPDAEIIFYCSGGSCAASKRAYTYFAERGYTRIAHYPGGLEEWEAAGYPLEGTFTALAEA